MASHSIDPNDPCGHVDQPEENFGQQLADDMEERVGDLVVERVAARVADTSGRGHRLHLSHPHDPPHTQSTHLRVLGCDLGRS